MPVGTARLAHLCLPDSELHVGVDFDDNPQVQAALAGEDGRPAYLLFPGPNAIDIAEVPVDRPITLVVVDGTWWLARKLTRRNAGLGALPQVRFTPPAPSRYRIRKEPAAHCVATVEALAHVLGVLERDPERFAGLLKPFEAMIDRQLHFGALGLDSIMGLELRNRLERALQRPLSATLAWNYPTVDALAAYLDALLAPHGSASGLGAAAADPAPPTGPTPVDGGLATLLAELTSLSDDDATRALREVS